MKLSIRNAVIAFAFLIGGGLGALYAQSVYPTIPTILGNEFVQIYSRTNNTAAIAYTTTANLRDGRGWVYNVPTTGFTITMTVAQSVVSLNPAGTLATGAIVMPPTADDGKTVSIFSSQTITALTLSTSNSATFVPAAVTTLAAGNNISYVYDLANNQWHRFE